VLVPTVCAGLENAESNTRTAPPRAPLPEETEKDRPEKDADAKMAGELLCKRRSAEIAGAPHPEAQKDVEGELQELLLLEAVALLLERRGESSAAMRDGVLTRGAAT
jgi:hypothetical protein